MNIGTLLRKLRDSRALTTRTIAEKAGVSLSTYLDWEHDKSSPSLRSFFKLASALDLDPVDFMAYLSGRTKDVLSTEEKASIGELKERVAFYRDYSDLLKKNSLQMENELARIKQEQLSWPTKLT